LNGIGTKKNAKIAAKYYRMAEKQGVKNVGLSWIWKEKYDEKDPRESTSKKKKKFLGRKRTA